METKLLYIVRGGGVRYCAVCYPVQPPWQVAVTKSMSPLVSHVSPAASQSAGAAQQCPQGCPQSTMPRLALFFPHHSPSDPGCHCQAVCPYGLGSVRTGTGLSPFGGRGIRRCSAPPGTPLPADLDTPQAAPSPGGLPLLLALPPRKEPPLPISPVPATSVGHRSPFSCPSDHSCDFS